MFGRKHYKKFVSFHMYGVLVQQFLNKVKVDSIKVYHNYSMQKALKAQLITLLFHSKKKPKVNGYLGQ
jgi:hypothetical protein